MQVPPTSLRVTKDALDLVNSKHAADAIWSYALMNRQRAVVVDDEIVSGDLIVAAAVFMNISYILVVLDHGNPEQRRESYRNNGSAHGVTIG